MLGLEWAPLAGALVGLMIGLTGVGGGALMAPLLIFGFGLDLASIIATDLLFASITKTVLVGIHQKNKFVDWKVTKRLWLGSIPTTFFVVWLIQKGGLSSTHGWLTSLLGALIFLSAVSLLLESQIQFVQNNKRLQKSHQFFKLQPQITILSGVVIGGLVTLTSVGAGALGVTFLRAIHPLRIKTQELIGTDTIHAIPVTFIGGFSYLMLGKIDLVFLQSLLLGSIPAAVVGAMLVGKISTNTIRIILVTALLLASLKLLMT